MQAPTSIDADPDENSDSPDNRGPDTNCPSQEARDDHHCQDGDIDPK